MLDYHIEIGPPYSEDRDDIDRFIIKTRNTNDLLLARARFRCKMPGIVHTWVSPEI